MGKTKNTGMYGMWSRKSKRFIFGIQEPSKSKAMKALKEEIGTFNRYFFYPKAILEGHTQFIGNGLGKEIKEEDLPLSKCCKAKVTRGAKISQDYKSIYCTKCRQKQN